VRLHPEWLSNAVTVPYVPTLGPVHPAADTTALFEAVLHAPAGQLLAYDKDARWTDRKDEHVLPRHVQHDTAWTTVATLNRRRGGRVTVYQYTPTPPDLSAAAPQARQLAADQHAGSARVVWFQHAPPATDVHRDATCVRVLLAPTGTVGEPPDRHVLALDDCPPAVRSTFADFAGRAAAGMAHLGRRWAQGSLGDPILVAVRDGRIVAAIGPMRTHPGPTGDRQLLPQYFAVLPAYRRGGYGRALWRAAQRWGRGAGAAYQLLQTAPGGPADRLYRSEGVDSLGYVCSVTVRSVTA
jgi:GNAT superfamily N-acetyltransferase